MRQKFFTFSKLYHVFENKQSKNQFFVIPFEAKRNSIENEEDLAAMSSQKLPREILAFQY